MVSEKQWAIINISLVGFIVLLTLNLFQVEVPSLGKAMGVADLTHPSCIVNSDPYNLDKCCMMMKNVLNCELNKYEFKGIMYSKECNIGKKMMRLNDEGIKYCQDQPYW